MFSTIVSIEPEGKKESRTRNRRARGAKASGRNRGPPHFPLLESPGVSVEPFAHPLFQGIKCLVTLLKII